MSAQQLIFDALYLALKSLSGGGSSSVPGAITVKALAITVRGKTVTVKTP